MRYLGFFPDNALHNKSINELMRRIEQREPQPAGPRYPTGLFRIHNPRREEVEQEKAFPMDHIEHTNS